jgi:heme/copper-type cytochrome/quinol oxidase subunit 2
MAASHLHPIRLRRTSLAECLKEFLPALALGLLLPAMVLAKTTAISLFPAVAYMVWARAGYRLRPALRLAIVPCVLGAAVWLAYFYGFVRPRYLEDYRYLFDANAYTGIALQPVATVVLNTLTDGLWMGKVLFVSFFAVVALVLFWRPRLLANPLVPALMLWIAGYTAFLLYHNNPQPRYYTVIAVPITVLVAIGLDNFRYAENQTAGNQVAGNRVARAFATTAVAAVVLGIVIPDAAQQIDFVLHPTYEFETAAQSIKRIVLADPAHSHLILSISGSDLTLMTGLPSIDDDFGTMDLDVRARVYQPGWYVEWNDIEDDKMESLAPYFSIQRVASFNAMDDPERNQMILYRLDPVSEQKTEPAPPRTRKSPTPKPLVTKVGQQPSTEQLQH